MKDLLLTILKRIDKKEIVDTIIQNSQFTQFWKCFWWQKSFIFKRHNICKYNCCWIKRIAQKQSEGILA